MINTYISETPTTTEVLDALLLRGLNSGGSFALWRKPKSSKLEYIQDNQFEPVKTELNLEESTPGFLVHPFADQADKKAFFIAAAEYHSFSLQSSSESEQIPNWMKEITEDTDSAKKTIRQKLQQINNIQLDSLYSESDCKSHFIGLVEKGIAEIKANKIEKVVPARTKKIDLNEDFDLSRSLVSMLNAYPNSFVNFFHIPNVGTWLGASPEVLIETKGDFFYTMSLAGTQPAKGDNPLKTAAWTQKEIEEQALVSRYIVDCFKKIRLREYEEHGPKTVMAGSLLHLRSDFKVNMKSTNFPQLGSVMLELLHPTSAVCGMPRKEAHEFLQENENLDRSFFSGFIGPVNIDGTTSIYVNLRTASFQENTAILYAGAGVTEESDPEQEWEETELKCQIIGKFIQNPGN